MHQNGAHDQMRVLCWCVARVPCFIETRKYAGCSVVQNGTLLALTVSMEIGAVPRPLLNQHLEKDNVREHSESDQRK